MLDRSCQDLVNSYTEWLRREIQAENIKGICAITTPFLDRHNDQIQIYVKKINNNLILTDDGYTLRDLKLSGFEITSEKRRLMVSSILNGFGVRLQDDELLVEAELEKFPQKNTI
ncbi:MAG: DUF1828 domain-containing protein [Candidatus Eremiobacteraeota bacterium]|nr:DUF1828 domain-containing protein [Candidatus Eremiobacteraeota bacterium]